MPYIVEKDYIKGTYLTRNAAIGARTLHVADASHFTAGEQIEVYDDTAAIIIATGLRGNTESITPTSVDVDENTLTLPDPGLVNSYTAQLSGNLYQADLAIGDRVEFDIPIKSRWCKIAQIKIVQQTGGKMDITFEVWEEIPIHEGNRIEMHKNIIRRNITLNAIQGGWYGESLVNNLILYRDGEVPAEGLPYNLHCALVNEIEGTVSDFHVLFKIAEIGELV